MRTPGGRISLASSAKRVVASGVSSAGLMTTVLPAASAGPSFQIAVRRFVADFQRGDHAGQLVAAGDGGGLARVDGFQLRKLIDVVFEETDQFVQQL